MASQTPEQASVVPSSENVSSASEKSSLEPFSSASAEQTRMLDAIDSLREKGIGQHDISFPQLIVCGDQSSGKSSVLEGITRLRFPTKDGLCTTFATELILRRNTKSNVHIRCSIIPGKDRRGESRKSLKAFDKVYTSKEQFDFPALVDDARRCMGLAQGAFSEDVLRINYNGPDIPSLTIVDLPGIIQNTSDPRNASAVDKVKGLVKGYMRDEKTIILAVIAAKTDIENQVVLTYSAEDDIDPKQLRTLGIITHPDRLDPGSESEKNYIEVARNHKRWLKLGWHVVKNRGFTTREASNEERDQSEKDFFSTGMWSSLDRNNVGIETLRKKLGKLLVDQIKKELPSLMDKIRHTRKEAEDSLKALGDARESKEELQKYLIAIAEKFRDDTSAALNHDPSPNKDEEKLRTRVTNLHFVFSRTMVTHGHIWRIQNLPPVKALVHDLLDPDSVKTYEAQFREPETITKDRFLRKHVDHKVRQSRTTSLSFLNMGIVSGLFREQSEKWEDNARFHIEQVEEAVKDYLEDCLSRHMDEQTFSALWVQHVVPELERRRLVMEERLADIRKPDGSQDPFMSFEMNDTSHHNGQANTSPNEDIPVLLQRYYKRSLSVFIHNAVELVIENCLIKDLRDIISSAVVYGMEEDVLRSIAGESDETRELRKLLRAKTKDLKEAEALLARHASYANIKNSKPSRKSRAPETPARPRIEETPARTTVEETPTRTRVEETPARPQTPQVRTEKADDSDDTLWDARAKTPLTEIAADKLNIPASPVSLPRRRGSSTTRPEAKTPSRSSPYKYGKTDLGNNGLEAPSQISPMMASRALLTADDDEL